MADMNLDEFDRWLKEGTARVINKFETETYLKVNSVTSSAAKNTAPVRAEGGGYLRDTIDTYGHVEATPEYVEMGITANAEYAIFVEYGTGYLSDDPTHTHTPKKSWVYRDEITGERHIGKPQKPKRFMRDAMAAVTDEVKDILKKDAIEALKDD